MVLPHEATARNVLVQLTAAPFVPTTMVAQAVRLLHTDLANYREACYNKLHAPASAE